MLVGSFEANNSQGYNADLTFNACEMFRSQQFAKLQRNWFSPLNSGISRRLRRSLEVLRKLGCCCRVRRRDEVTLGLECQALVHPVLLSLLVEVEEALVSLNLTARWTQKEHISAR